MSDVFDVVGTYSPPAPPPLPTCLTPQPAPLAEAPAPYPVQPVATATTVSTDHRPANPEYFHFDASVANVFDDMAVRSIPGYRHFWDMVANIVHYRGIPRWSEAWDMGISTGAGIEAIKRGAGHPYVSYHGVDISEPMCEKARERAPYAAVSVHDLRKGLPKGVTKGKVGAFVWGWTLQFLDDMCLRRELLKECAYHLAEGGMIFIGEKYRLEDAEEQQIAQDAYIAWRLANGYSLRSIEEKTKALANAMHPWMHSDIARTAEVLNLTVTPIYRQFNFGGYMLRR